MRLLGVKDPKADSTCLQIQFHSYYLHVRPRPQLSAIFVALKCKVRETAAITTLQTTQLDADEAQTALESAKIHGCIDRTRRRQVEAVFDVLRDSVLVIDAHGEILHANECAAGLLSVRPEDAAGMPSKRSGY